MLWFSAAPALPKTQWPGRAGSGSPAVDKRHMFTLARQLNAKPHKFPVWHFGIFQHCSCKQQVLFSSSWRGTLRRKLVFFLCNQFDRIVNLGQFWPKFQSVSLSSGTRMEGGRFQIVALWKMSVFQLLHLQGSGVLSSVHMCKKGKEEHKSHIID